MKIQKIVVLSLFILSQSFLQGSVPVKVFKAVNTNASDYTKFYVNFKDDNGINYSLIYDGSGKPQPNTASTFVGDQVALTEPRFQDGFYIYIDPKTQQNTFTVAGESKTYNSGIVWVLDSNGKVLFDSSEGKGGALALGNFEFPSSPEMYFANWGSWSFEAGQAVFICSTDSSVSPYPSTLNLEQHIKKHAETKIKKEITTETGIGVVGRAKIGNNDSGVAPSSTFIPTKLYYQLQNEITWKEIDFGTTNELLVSVSTTNTPTDIPGAINVTSAGLGKIKFGDDNSFLRNQKPYGAYEIDTKLLTSLNSKITEPNPASTLFTIRAKSDQTIEILYGATTVPSYETFKTTDVLSGGLQILQTGYLQDAQGNDVEVFPSTTAGSQCNFFYKLNPAQGAKDTAEWKSVEFDKTKGLLLSFDQDIPGGVTVSKNGFMSVQVGDSNSMLYNKRPFGANAVSTDMLTTLNNTIKDMNTGEVLTVNIPDNKLQILQGASFLPPVPTDVSSDGLGIITQAYLEKSDGTEVTDFSSADSKYTVAYMLNATTNGLPEDPRGSDTDLTSDIDKTSENSSNKTSGTGVTEQNPLRGFNEFILQKHNVLGRLSSSSSYKYTSFDASKGGLLMCVEEDIPGAIKVSKTGLQALYIQSSNPGSKPYSVSTSTLNALNNVISGLNKGDLLTLNIEDYKVVILHGTSKAPKLPKVTVGDLITSMSVPNINLSSIVDSTNAKGNKDKVSLLSLDSNSTTFNNVALTVDLYSGTAASSAATYTLTSSGSPTPENKDLNTLLLSFDKEELQNGMFMYPYTADEDGNNIDTGTSKGSATKPRAVWVAVYGHTGAIKGAYKLSDSQNPITVAVSRMSFNYTDGTTGQTGTAAVPYGHVLFITTNENLVVDNITLDPGITGATAVPGAVGIVNLKAPRLQTFELQIPFTDTQYAVIDDSDILTAINGNNYVSLAVDITKNTGTGTFSATVLISYKGLKEPVTKTIDKLDSWVYSPITKQLSNSGDKISLVDRGKPVAKPKTFYAVYTAEGSTKTESATLDTPQMVVVKPQQMSAEQVGGVGVLTVPSSKLTEFNIEANFGGGYSIISINQPDNNQKNGLDELKKALAANKHVSISCDYEKNFTNGFDATVTLHQAGTELFRKTFTSVKLYTFDSLGNLNETSTPISQTDNQGNPVPVPTEVSVSYKIQGATKKQQQNIGGTHFVVLTNEAATTSTTVASLGVGVGEIPADTQALNLVLYWDGPTKGQTLSSWILLAPYLTRLMRTLNTGPVICSVVPNFTTNKINVTAKTPFGSVVFFASLPLIDAQYQPIPAGSKLTGIWGLYSGADNKVQKIPLAALGAQQFVLTLTSDGGATVAGSSDSLLLAPNETVSGLEVAFNFTPQGTTGTLISNPVALPADTISKINQAFEDGKYVVIHASVIPSGTNFVPKIIVQDSQNTSLLEYPAKDQTADPLQTTQYGSTYPLSSNNVVYTSMSVGYQTSNMNSMKLAPGGKHYIITRSNKAQLVTPGKAITLVPDTSGTTNGSRSNNNKSGSDNKKTAPTAKPTTPLEIAISDAREQSKENETKRYWDVKRAVSGYRKNTAGIQSALTQFSGLNPGQIKAIIKDLPN